MLNSWIFLWFKHILLLINSNIIKWVGPQVLKTLVTARPANVIYLRAFQISCLAELSMVILSDHIGITLYCYIWKLIRCDNDGCVV